MRFVRNNMLDIFLLWSLVFVCSYVRDCTPSQWQFVVFGGTIGLSYGIGQIRERRKTKFMRVTITNIYHS